MKEELQNKLYENFPLLYGDRNKSMRHTCMCWGIETNDGWYNIIKDLSEKLENQIQKFYEENPNLNCYACGCKRDEHYASRTDNPGKCLCVKKRPRKRHFVWCAPWYMKFINIFYWIFNWFHRQFNYDLVRCYCEKYDPYIPRATQVKEKYGTLRFYMNVELDGMNKHIAEAECKSANTCEICGQPGSIRNGAWIVTRCDDCFKK